MTKYDDQRRKNFRKNAIHVGAGFVARERTHIVDMLSALGPHLGKWDPSDVDLDVSLQDRGGKEQRVTLRTILPGQRPLIAVAENPDINHALSEAKRELIRQLEHQKSVNEPMNNRRLRRATIRHPGASASPQSTEFATAPKSQPSQSASLLPRADSETIMTHITEERVVGNHAGMALRLSRHPENRHPFKRYSVRV